MPWTDAHLHCPKKGSAADFLEILKRRNIYPAALCGTSPADWPFVLQVKDTVRPFVGLHPWWTEEESPHWASTLQRILTENATVGVGEIGLDARHKSSSPSVFQFQLDLAVELNRPVVIHCVHDWDRMTAILREKVGKRPLPLMFHRFAGSPEQAKELSRFNAFFSFAAGFCDLKSARFQRCIRSIPAERLLLESDAEATDDMQELEPFYEAVAAVREISVETLATQMAENLRRFCG